MMYCVTGKCGANVDVNENRGRVFVQCSRGIGMQCESGAYFYPEELCHGCTIAPPASHYLDDCYDGDGDECNYDDDDGDITCFE